MKIKYCIVFLLGIVSQKLDAQKLIMDVLDPKGTNNQMGSGINSKTLVGSMYLTDWQEGYLVYGQKKEKRKMRYNAFKDALHVIDNQNKEIVVQEGQVETFIIVDHNVEYTFKWLNNLPKINYGYVQLIYENNVKVYYRHSRKMNKTVSGTESYTPSIETDAFVQDDSYIIIRPDGTSYLTKTKRKDILAIFSDKKTDLETFMKAEKVDTQTLTGLMKVVQKYEELLKK